MNTFAVLLLAFPFYLAVNGRLIPTYTDLVKKSASGSATAASSTASSIQPIKPLS